MTNTKRFHGTGVAIITPFKSDHSIDFESFGSLIDHVIINKIDYIVVLGTTGEAATLSREEKKEVVDFTVKTVHGRVPLVVGAGGYSTFEVVEYFDDFDFTSIDAILSVTPYYNKPNQTGLYEHFKVIVQHSPVPVILYNVPGRTGINMTADTTLKISHDFGEKVIAVKEASGNLEQIGRIIKYKPEHFEVISGDDALAVPSIAIGAKGVISVLANAFPNEVSRMINAALRNDFSEAARMHLAFLDFYTAMFEEGSPAGIKAVLSVTGKCENQLRLPLTPVSNTLYGKLKLLTDNFS
ncbi:MAG: 4-hydroxy-tetrahydrodipicolinate synthase [Bacteroidia bacterium]|nr:4-hydroxy-tetrahydrodipicolinate synthase [Bacteroidia bacterium]